MSELRLDGEWDSTYHYGEHGEHSSKHVMVFEYDSLIGQSLPQEDGSEVNMALRHDPKNNVLTGFWQEATSPTGTYKGDIFHGALQLILNDTLTRAEGEWVGFDRARSTVGHGKWVLEKCR